MRSRASGHVGVGATCATLGAGTIVAGLARPGFLQVGLAGTPLWALAIAGGGALALVGAATLVLSLRRTEEPEPEVLAHVAFNSRMTIPDAMPIPTPRPVAAAAPIPQAAPARLPAPAPVQQRRVPPPRADIAKIDIEIRELSKKINKAGVMLATGQLSQQGYLAYVEDLKRKRGALEAQRVRAELHG